MNKNLGRNIEDIDLLKSTYNRCVERRKDFIIELNRIMQNYNNEYGQLLWDPRGLEF